jgi:hypothetical protein
LNSFMGPHCITPSVEKITVRKMRV